MLSGRSHHYPVFDRNDFLASPRGILAQHRRRRRERIYLHIEGVEPRKKETMPDADKDKIQSKLLEYLQDFGRRAFRGPIALKVRLQTTEKTPTYSHHVAKNLLDLFGPPRRGMRTQRRGLLYADDDQVQALSVTCHHGEAKPGIQIFACPLESLLRDLDLATQWARENMDRHFEQKHEDRLNEALKDFRESRSNEQRLRREIGDAGYEGLLSFSRRRLQELLLGHGALRPQDLAAMYDVAGRKLGVDLAAQFERGFASSPLRIRLSGLPQERGSSEQWKREIDAKLRDFQKRYCSLIDPWLVPVALEVLIKPPRHEKNVHDLDNVVRTYLIPKVVEILKPVSNLAFTFDPESIRRTAPKLYAKFKASRQPPPSTKIGVSRYEVWRLRPAKKDTDAFVSVAVVADTAGVDDALGQVEDLIGEWRAALERSA